MQVYHPAHCFLVLPVLLVISTASAQVIHEGPQNITVFQNQPANFTCVVEGGTTGWMLNGTVENDLPPDVRKNIKKTLADSDRGRLVTLTLNAIAEYNGTTVQCVTYENGNPQQSETVTMTIQGLVSAVGDLKLAESSTSITISWSPPFSLDVTGVDPDIWYSVFIYNVTDENNPTAILCTNCTNITETHYTFTPDYLSPCHVYNLSVVPLNGAGQGEGSLNVTGYTLENRNLSVTSIGPDIEALPDGKWHAGPKNNLGIIIGIPMGVIVIVIVAVVALVVCCCCCCRKTTQSCSGGGLCSDGSEKVEKDIMVAPALRGAKEQHSTVASERTLSTDERYQLPRSDFKPFLAESEPPSQADDYDSTVGAIREKEYYVHYSSSSGEEEAGGYIGSTKLRRRALRSSPCGHDMWKEDEESSG